jgi:hypothetical protein
MLEAFKVALEAFISRGEKVREEEGSQNHDSQGLTT